MYNSIFAKTDFYINNLLAEEDNALRHAIESIISEGISQESISPAQGKLLQVLMTSCNAKRVLELGTLGGYSTIWMAKALPEDGKIVTVEAIEKHATVAQKNFQYAGLSGKVELINGKAMDVLTEMVKTPNVTFDFIFIDADKPPYTEYFEFAMKLSRKGTIIVCDNVIRAGKVLDAESTDEKVRGVRRFNEMLSKNTGVIATIIQSVGVKEHDGMSIAVVK